MLIWNIGFDQDKKIVVQMENNLFYPPSIDFISGYVIDTFGNANPKPDEIDYDVSLGMSEYNKMDRARLPMKQLYDGPEANTINTRQLIRTNITS